MIKYNIIWYNMLVDFYLVYYVVYFFFIYIGMKINIIRYYM